MVSQLLFLTIFSLFLLPKIPYFITIFTPFYFLKITLFFIILWVTPYGFFRAFNPKKILVLNTYIHIDIYMLQLSSFF